MSTLHALSCFTSTASPATRRLALRRLQRILHLQHFRHLQHFLHLQHVFTCDPPTLHVLPAVLHRSCHPPSCASCRPSCDCSTCGPPTSACCTCMAPALSSAQRHLQHGNSTAPPDTTPLCACVFLSVPRQIRLVLSPFGTGVSSLPLCCTPRDGAAAPAAGDLRMLVRNASGCCLQIFNIFIWVLAIANCEGGRDCRK